MCIRDRGCRTEEPDSAEEMRSRRRSATKKIVPVKKKTVVHNKYEVLREEMEEYNEDNGQDAFWIDLSGDEEEEPIASHKMRRSKTEIIPTEVRVPVEMRPKPSCSVWTCGRRANYPCDHCEAGFCWFHLG